MPIQHRSLMKSIRSILIFGLLCLITGCSPSSKESPGKETQKPVYSDLTQIREKGKLVALTGFDATSYFIYRGEPMGYEYELLQRLADDLNIDFEIKIVRNLDNIFNDLNEGSGDIITHGLTVTKKRAEKVSFTRPNIIVRQMLVQRKPQNWRKMKLHEIEKQLLRNPIDLIDKYVHVRKNSSYYSRLLNLSDEIGGDIKIVQVPGNVTTEELIEQVSDGKIQFTVADENIALINRAYYPDINTATALSMPQQIAWAIRKNSPELLNTVNVWLDSMKTTTDYYVIYNKYFKNKRAFKERSRSDYYAGLHGGQISPYDNQIKVEAKRIGWDWQILAAQIYQESQFDPKIESWAGAVGLMQLMPKTAKQFGAKNLKDPVESITVGVNYLIWLDDYWKKELGDSPERRKFVLGSYNVGYNHVQDARRLAQKNGANADVWDDNVSKWLLKKCDPDVYNDPVVRFGYARGTEPVKYVSEILDLAEHYKKLVKPAGLSQI